MTDLLLPESQPLDPESARYFHAYQDRIAARTDRMMALLLAIEWAGAIVTALCLSPRTWDGPESRLHPHVWTAILSGPAIVFLPVALALMRPARTLTRHVIAACQLAMSSVLIDITGGRIETHFHVFGSLAFLAFYRDWRVLVTASAVTAVDHIVRGIWWPQSVYGVLTTSPWRWVEHAWWVIFEDIFLFWSSRRSLAEMRTVALRETQLAFGAYHDVLTGLANRRMLSERFHRSEKNEGKRGAILFIDLDRFKHVNDTLGHTVGDKLLVRVAERLSDVLQANDTVARVGGDEFVVLLEGESRAREAEKTGAKLLAVLNRPFDLEGQQVLLSGSVGISLFPEHGSKLEDLQEAADRAMYEAKAQGRNQCALFAPEMTRRDATRKQLKRDLYHAVSRNELQVHFQPLVTSDLNIKGFEALLRWQHPELGWVSPAEFIPIAEKTGAIVGMGEWVLRQACRKCRDWQTAGFPGTGVSVNVSAAQFEIPRFVDDVIDILHEYDLDPGLLTLELTETVLFQNLKQTSHQLNRLRMHGIRIALDDFGTGYSSLSYLHSLPTDSIKLDRGFINRAFEESPAIVESLIEMAHRIGLQVVAEGVETRAQHDSLRNLECDRVQGFYFSPAVPPDSVLALLEAHSPARELAPAF